MTNIIEAKILTGPFKGEDVLIPRIPMIPADMSFQIGIPNLISICNHDQQSTGTIFSIVWLIFTHWLLLTWAIICSRVGNPDNLFIYTENGNYQKYCVSTSIGKLNILETCIFFFFFPHLNKLSHSNMWQGTASIYIYIYIYIYIFLFKKCFNNKRWRL